MDRLRQARIRPPGIALTAGGTGGDTLRPARQVPVDGPVAVRPARASDADFIRSLSREAFRRYGPYEDLLPNWFLSGIGLVLVALMGKRPAGFAMLERIGGTVTATRISELLAIAVVSRAQRCGVGDRLMEAIIRKADTLMVDRLVLHTAVDNLPGQALFRKHGFAPYGIETRFYPEGQDALVMRREKASGVRGEELTY
jgi:ribosomal protein S18 acetylase RimI-like enzyme